MDTTTRLRPEDLLMVRGLSTRTEVDLSDWVAPGFTGQVVQVSFGKAPEFDSAEEVRAWCDQALPVSVTVTSDGRRLDDFMHQFGVDGPEGADDDDPGFFWVQVGENAGPLGHGFGHTVSRKVTQVG